MSERLVRVERDALLSPDQRYRYWLSRTWKGLRRSRLRLLQGEETVGKEPKSDRSPPPPTDVPTDLKGPTR